MKKIWNFISALKNATGNLVFLGIVVLILVAIFGRDTVTVPESAVLILNPQGMIVEAPAPSAPATASLRDRSANGFRRIWVGTSPATAS